MSHVVTESCIACKYTTCVDACPVKDCFKEGANMLVIDPALCIDCGKCIEECPVEAIVHDQDPRANGWLLHNFHYSKIWPSLNISKTKLPDADEMAKKKNKKHLLQE